MKSMAQSNPFRVALVTSGEIPSWVSCRAIQANLHTAYENAFGPEVVREFHYKNGMERGASVEQLWRLACDIRAAAPDRIVFIDYLPHPSSLLRALAEVYAPNPLPSLYFHVYGDFLLRAGSWLQLDEVLKRTKVKWVCASPRQARLVSRILSDASTVAVYPFPVDSSQFFYSEGVRRAERARLGIADDETVFIYTGRISHQKRVLDLIKHWSDCSANGLTRARLLIAGPPDDLGSPYFGVSEKLGEGFQNFQAALAAVAPEIRSRISYLGDVAQSELPRVYNAADCFVSLSLHHDEDFGMSVAESLCCGTRAVLTDWGGFSGFVVDELGVCRLVRLKPDSAGQLDIDFAEFRRQIFAAQGVAPAEERRNRAKRYIEKLGLETLAPALLQIHREPAARFAGFTETMSAVAKRMTLLLDSRSFAPFPEGMTRGTFYDSVYSAYYD
jgi:glycosyltransferase involved in cell wall biosynthesis